MALTKKTGQCMCGAVSFTVANPPFSFGACHCEMCRRWSGSAFLGISVLQSSVTFDGEAHIRTIQSSTWAERAWCQRCGSSLYYRLVDGDTLQLSLGLLDDPNGMTFSDELFIDCKPDSYAFEGKGRSLVTRQEIMDRYFSGGDA
ncbi:GFA family protein [Pseudooceanicola sp. C21-150M6]|uniref:GFA family protein n=1 Tax=Pseudooceanicola sp. C21-150M6 TaxID=3434355 RepID=UPI003D7F44E9